MKLETDGDRDKMFPPTALLVLDTGCCVCDMQESVGRYKRIGTNDVFNLKTIFLKFIEVYSSAVLKSDLV